MMYKDDKEMKRMKKGHGGKHGRSMYMGGGMRESKMYGGEAKQGAQPMYGSTVADAMPVAGKN